MARCGMTAPHCTTIAHFVSTLRADIAQVFAAVLAVCDGQGLIGREMFAIDGVKLPSNASKHQIIVDAQVHGTGAEHELLLPVVEALAALRTSETLLTADAGSHREANLAALAALHVTTLIADPDMRKRDERFADREHHTQAPDPLHDKTGNAKTSLPLFAPSDFTYDVDARTGVCPAGKSLYRKGASNVTNGYVGEHFRGAKRDCAPCALRDQCLRTPATTVVRNVTFFRGREAAEAG